jgi:hypothetical protein
MAQLPPPAAANAPETTYHYATANHPWTFPHAENVPSLLPHETSASVVKFDSLAAIRIIFRETSSQCRLEMDIYARKVPYIARELFGCTLEEQDGRLWMRFVESGARGAFPTFTLFGADRGGAEKLFGGLYWIVRGDPLYVEEVEAGEPVSSLVSLDIGGRAGYPGCLKIRSTAQTLSIVAKKLWPESPVSS